MFEIVEDEPIKFDPNLRSNQDFLHTKEQISSWESNFESDGFNPVVTKEETLEIGNPIIRGIILDQELVPQNYDPKQSILFIHLMFLSFPELRQNNSIMVKRKFVLLKLFEQSTYRYQRQGEDYWFGKKLNIQDQMYDVQNEIQPKDQRMASQCIEKRSTQDLKRRYQSRNYKDSQFVRFKQIESKTQIQLRELRQTSQGNSIRFYFRSNYPIEIEQLSSHKIKMTFSKSLQSVHRWPQLDLSSYYNLMTTHPKAFHCWTSMLKLFNTKQFQAFIDNQFGESESEDEIANNDFNSIDQLPINNDLKLDNIVRIDNRKSIVKFPNKVIIIEQFKIKRNLKSIEQQIETVNSLFMKQNYLDREIEKLQKQFQIYSTLEECHDDQKQLVPCNEAQCIVNAQPTLLQEQLNTTIPEPNNNRVVYSDKAIQTSFNQSMDNKQNINQDHQIRFDQYAYQQDNNICARQLMPVVRSTLPKKGVKYHSGQWKFGKQYPVQINRFTKSSVLMKMKDKQMIIVEWWQFDYESLKNFERVSLPLAQTWNVLLMLIDEDQYFKLWKGEVIEQIQIKEEEQGQQNTFQIPEQYDLTQLHEIIVENDFKRFIVKFRDCVQLLKKSQFEKGIIQKYEEENQKIVWTQTFYNRKIKMFKELILEQRKKKSKSQQPLPYQITQGQIKSNLLKATVDPQLPTGLWIFNEDYPVRINMIDKDSLKFEFQQKIKNTTVKWEQLDYHSLIKLIEKRINIRAGQIWSLMLILLDHDQFYKLWKNYHLWRSNLIAQVDGRQVKDSQQSGTSNKGEPPDYMPQRIIKDEYRLIVKFQNYVKIFQTQEFAQYIITMEIPEAELNKLRINVISTVYNQNIKALQERLNLEEEQSN